MILLVFALELVASGRTERAEGATEPSISLAITPFAMLLVATPQGIVAVVTLAAANPEPLGLGALAGTVAVIMAIDYLCLRYSDVILRAIGESGILVLARHAGLFLAAMPCN